jgi:hypothetical protein
MELSSTHAEKSGENNCPVEISKKGEWQLNTAAIRFVSVYLLILWKNFGSLPPGESERKIGIFSGAHPGLI